MTKKKRKRTAKSPRPRLSISEMQDVAYREGFEQAKRLTEAKYDDQEERRQEFKMVCQLVSNCAQMIDTAVHAYRSFARTL